MRIDTANELVRIVLALSGKALDQSSANALAERHSFVRTKAKAEFDVTSGTETFFVREGALGRAAKHFKNEAVDAMMTDYRELIARLGYQR